MSTVKLKRSAVPNKIPLTTDLELGELAVNTNDGKLFLKRNNGADSIREIGAVTIEKNGTAVGTRRNVNFIEGTNITLTVADDSANDEVDITINASGGGGPTNLDSLTDVVITSPTNTQVLKYNGTNWVNAADSGATDLDSLTDVVITSPTNNQVLKYNGTNWVNGVDSGATNLDSLTDVVITTPSTGQVLKYNGTNWVNDTDATGGGGGNLDSLTDVVITTPSTGQVLKYNGTNWVNDTDATGGGGGITTGKAIAMAIVFG